MRTELADPAVVAAAPPFRIRYKRAEDLAEDYAWLCDPELARFDGRRPLTVSYEEFLRDAADEVRYASPWGQSLSIVDGEGRHVGNATFYNVSPGRDSAEIGMLLADPALRGRGDGRRLAVAFIRYLWENHPFRTLRLHTLDWNERAIRCFARAGFEPTARVYRDDAWFLRMEARREWWLLWDSEGRFAEAAQPPRPDDDDARKPG
jgi:RimJ/RimL family protein N-acetyltransferase